MFSQLITGVIRVLYSVIVIVFSPTPGRNKEGLIEV